jgi:hypothetical protein
MNNYTTTIQLMEEFRRDLLSYIEGIKRRSLLRQADHDRNVLEGLPETHRVSKADWAGREYA